MGGSLPEVGIVLYPGAQMAAVLGMTDLFGVAEQQARQKSGQKHGPLLRVSHWSKPAPDQALQRVFDTAPGMAGEPTVLILPPALGEPISREQAAQYADWLR